MDRSQMIGPAPRRPCGRITHAADLPT